MSGEGPDSVPTSADPRSHRPTKRRALTPSSSQAASLDALFAKPDQSIRIPDSSSALSKSKRPLPPEIVSNVQGSSAGAGSGEFHVYKASRRREYERLREMDAEVQAEKGKEEFEREREKRERRDEEKTRRNREKREKMKARKGKKGKGGGNDDDAAAAAAAPSSGIKPRGATTSGAEDAKRADGEGVAAPSNGVDASSAAVKQSGLVIHDDD